MEMLHSENERVTRLCEYLDLLVLGKNTRESHDPFSALLETATPFEVNAALDLLLARVEQIESVKIPVSRFIRSLSKALDAQVLEVYPANHILAALDAENNQIADSLEKLQTMVKEVQRGASSVKELTQYVQSMTILTEHYTSLQNGLFPLFEKASTEHGCVKLMWAIQNDVIESQKKLCKEASLSPFFWKLLGSFYLTAGALAYREKYILFPVAFRAITAHIFSQRNDETTNISMNTLAPVFNSITGSLEGKELEAIFKILPIDIAFIGADDRVKFYSDPPHRIFPRTPAVIGRLVQNCHPPKSVAVVTEILSSFKTGSRNDAEFWLSVKDQFVHIQYFAIRTIEGSYLGTLEVSQDATHIRSLEGEKRLL